MLSLKNLKKYRTEAGMTQAELGKLLGVSKYTVSVWDCGRRLPEWNTMEKLSEIFGVSIYRLIECESEQASSERWSALVSDFMMRFWELDEKGREAVRLLIMENGGAGEVG